MIEPEPTTKPTTMNEETKTPETLAAILAEMRDFADHRAADAGGERPGIEPLRSYADRIEAAAERERAEIRRDAEIEWTRIGYDERKAEEKRAPGNAAAMREALEWAAQFVELGVDDELGADGQNLTTAAEMARAALSAPARNCDRFQTAADAVAAFADHLRAWENAHGIHSEYPDHPVQVPAGAFAWLFAPAEGVGHA